MSEFDLKNARRNVAVVRRTLGPANDQWRHVKTGKLYWIQAVCIREADVAPLVVYRDAEVGTCWARPASEFLDGRFERVFYEDLEARS